MHAWFCRHSIHEAMEGHREPGHDIVIICAGAYIWEHLAHYMALSRGAHVAWWRRM